MRSTDHRVIEQHQTINRDFKMRILLTILLLLMACATAAATIQIVNLPSASLLLKIPPIAFVACTIISLIMHICRQKLAFAPYIVGFGVFLAANIYLEGVPAIPKAAMGFIVAVLFFVPSVQNAPGKSK